MWERDYVSKSQRIQAVFKHRANSRLYVSDPDVRSSTKGT